MLPENLQLRHLTELTYGKEVDTDLRKFSEPYRTAVEILQLAAPEKRIDLLFTLGQWHEKIREAVQQVQGINFEKDLGDYDQDWADAQAEEPPVEWLWPEWIPRRHISLLTSQGGVGKSAVVLDWVARWLTRREMPDGQHINRRGDHIVFCDGEDFFQEYANRTRIWQDAGIWPKTKHTGVYLHRRIHKSKAAHLNPDIDKWQLIDFANHAEQDRLVDLVYRRRPEWLIIDSVSATFADTTFDKDVREPLGFLTALADEYNLAVTLIHHYNKAQRLDQPPDVNNIKGAGAFVNFCRSVFTLHYEKINDPERVDRKRDPRILSPLKNNFIVPDPIGVYFKPLHPVGFYIDYGPADEIFAMVEELRRQEAEASETVVEACADWIVDVLLHKGPASRADLIGEGKVLGYTAFTIDQAKRQLGETVVDTLGFRKKGNKWALKTENEDDELQQGNLDI